MGYHSGLPDNASIAAQQAAGNTNLVTAAEKTLLTDIATTGLSRPERVACPAFTAGAASLAMGTSKVTECVVESTRTLTQASALTIPVTDMVAGQLYAVSCYALALGYALTVVSATVTLATFEAALTKPKMHVFFFDGVALFYDHTEFVK
jgi:hypothetical protein